MEAVSLLAWVDIVFFWEKNSIKILFKATWTQFKYFQQSAWNVLTEQKSCYSRLINFSADVNKGAMINKVHIFEINWFLFLSMRSSAVDSSQVECEKNNEFLMNDRYVHLFVLYLNVIDLPWFNFGFYHPVFCCRGCNWTVSRYLFKNKR